MRIGRSEPAELALHQEEHLAAVHFALNFDGAACRLSVPPGGGEVRLEGQLVTEALLEDGSSWAAGPTWFRLRLHAPAQPPRLSRRLATLLEQLWAAPAPLLTLLDAARDEQILSLLRASDEESQSLYEGLQGQILSEQAPYLVRLTPESAFLSTLLQQGWGKNWGLFVSSCLPFAEVRRHFRRFLFVEDSARREVYLRFYDPRVLRALLPALSASQAAAFFEGIDALLLEGESPQELIRFTWAERGLRREQVSLETGGSHAAP
ncbi:MAG TPA: DUF4123 domain-containing protein [Archangium sp.]|nr:DUF4123 domain-containing protein [Archangium sp.]